MSGAINPSEIPGGDIHPDTIIAQASSITKAAQGVRDNGAEVVTAWQGLSAVYEAPEAQRLFNVMTPVGSSTTGLGDQFDIVAGALKNFAEEVRPIVAELKSLKLQAETFVNTTVAHGVTVRVPVPTGLYGTAPTYNGAYNGYGASQRTSAAATPQYRDEHKAWNEDQGAVDRNNDLIAQVNAQQVRLWEAERTCANAIRGLYGASPLHAATGENDANGYGIAEIPEGTDMPWGSAVERKEGCGEASVKFVFRDVLWEGIAVGGVWGTVTGLGSLALGYNPQTGDFFSGETYGQAWGGLGMLAVGLVATSPVGFAASFIPGPVGDFLTGGQEAVVNTLKGVVAWDDWEDNPGKALGTSIFNIGTIFIPAGAAVSGAKTAAGAGRILSNAAKVAEFIDPAAWAVKGGLKTVKFAGPPILDALKGLKSLDLDGLGSTGAKIDIPDAGVGKLDWSPDGASTSTPGTSTGTGGAHSAPDGGNLGSTATGSNTTSGSVGGNVVDDAASNSVKQGADNVGAPEPRPAEAPAVREPVKVETDAPAVREPVKVGAESTVEAPVKSGADTPAVREPAANADGPSSGNGGGTDVLDRPATGHPEGGGTRGDGGPNADGGGTRLGDESSGGAGQGDSGAGGNDVSGSDGPGNSDAALPNEAPADRAETGGSSENVAARPEHIIDSSGRDLSNVIDQSSLTPDQLQLYLENADPSGAATFAETGVWPEDVQIPKDIGVLTPEGTINWSEVPQGGYVLDEAGNAIKEPYVPGVGEVIDRYGPPNGRFTSPVEDGVPYSYDQRSLPYVEDAAQYHQYEVVGDFSDLRAYYDQSTNAQVRSQIDGLIDLGYFSWDDLPQSGQIAPGFGDVGGGTQVQLPLSVEILEALGVLREVK